MEEMGSGQQYLTSLQAMDMNCEASQGREELGIIHGEAHLVAKLSVCVDRCSACASMVCCALG